MTKSADKRRQARAPIDLWIEVDREGELYFQRAVNISVGGAYFAQTIPLPLGTRVKLKFSLPGEAHEIHCDGDIVTARAFGMGVRFVALREPDRVRIVRYIEAVKPHQNPPQAVTRSKPDRP
jgi:hypothetical protein